ncbi:MAG: hypothetical protein MO852_10375 [Candidatus Devosia euplotis]|nr:hypothetical protein [Candidatus Devosia euplotis]
MPDKQPSGEMMRFFCRRIVEERHRLDQVELRGKSRQQAVSVLHEHVREQPIFLDPPARAIDMGSNNIDPAGMGCLSRICRVAKPCTGLQAASCHLCISNRLDDLVKRLGRQGVKNLT